MEVSALKLSGGVGLHGFSPLLRVQSDERLVALTRRGNEAAFEVLVSRYEARLLSFCRHLLGSHEDAEDVLQEVLAAAYNALLADDRPIQVRPWLYRIARNRSLNHLRRVPAIGVDSMDVHLSDHGASTADKAHEREEFRLLVADIHDLPETQRTALVLREMEALSYEQIAEAMDTTVPSVKSLLVRARVSLAEAAEARLISCDEVRDELGEIAEGLRRRPTPPVRRHLRSCARCSAFRRQLRDTNRALAAVLPLGPLVVLRKLLLTGLSHHAGSGATAAGTGATAAGTAGGSLLVGSSGGGLLTAGVGALATKAAAGLAAAALVTAAGVEVAHLGHRHHHHRVQHALAAPTPLAVVAESATQVATGGHHALARRRAAARRGSRAVSRRHDARRTVRHAAASRARRGRATAWDRGQRPATVITAPRRRVSRRPGRTQSQTIPTVLPPMASIGSTTGAATGTGMTTTGTTSTGTGTTSTGTTGTSTSTGTPSTTPTGTTSASSGGGGQTGSTATGQP